MDTTTIEPLVTVEPVRMRDLQVGDWAIFDPILGPERVIAVRVYTLANGVDCLHFNVWDERTGSDSFYAPFGTGRFIVRAEHEPIMLRRYAHEPVVEGDA